MSTVEYRPIPGWPRYYAGDDGTIWCDKPRGGSAWRRLRGTPLGTPLGTVGRVYVNLSHRGRARKAFVSRLVLLAFVGPPPSVRHQAAHGNGDPTDNRLVNLRWATPRENEADKLRHGTKLLGERTNAAKLTAEQVRSIRREAADGAAFNRLAVKYGVTGTNIGYIVRGKSWAHV